MRPRTCRRLLFQSFCCRCPPPRDSAFARCLSFWFRIRRFTHLFGPGTAYPGFSHFFSIIARAGIFIFCKDAESSAQTLLFSAPVPPFGARKTTGRHGGKGIDTCQRTLHHTLFCRNTKRLVHLWPRHGGKMLGKTPKPPFIETTFGSLGQLGLQRSTDTVTWLCLTT